MLTPQPEESRRGPLEPFEKSALIGFAVAAILHTGLGLYRGDSFLPGTIAIVVCAALWLLRARRMSGGVLAVPAGLFFATIGLYSAYTALNTPFVSIAGRFAVPLLLIFTGALLLFADQDWQFQIVPLALAAIAFIVTQVVLTTEARAGGRSIPIRSSAARGGVIGELQLVPLAQSFVDAINARDAAAIVALTTPDHRFIDSRGNSSQQVPDDKITVTRWIVEDNTVVAFGTSSGVPAVWRATVRNGKIAEWQIYANNGRGAEP